MKKLFYLGFALVLAAGVGCALTNYQLITDNDQLKNQSAPTSTVNTNGKAHVIESSQIATVYPDFLEETLWFVDQRTNGDRTLTTYINRTTDPVYYGGPNAQFHDDLYCNPDWQGCAVVTAQDPEVGDVDIYDYAYNPRCESGPTVYYLFSTTRYYGECGRSLQDVGALIMMGQPKKDGLFYLLTPANTNILLTSKSDGTTTAMTLPGDVSVFVSGQRDRHATVDLTNPVFGSFKNALATHGEIHGANNEITLQFNGLSKTFATRLMIDNLHNGAKRF